MSLGEGDCDLRGWCFVDSVGEILLIREGDMDHPEEVLLGEKGGTSQVTEETGGSESMSCSHAESANMNDSENGNNSSFSELKSQSSESLSFTEDSCGCPCAHDDSASECNSGVVSVQDSYGNMADSASSAIRAEINMSKSEKKNKSSIPGLKCQSSEVLSLAEVSCHCSYTDDDSASDCNCGSDTSSETTDLPEETEDLVRQYIEDKKKENKKREIHHKKENSSSSDISVLDVKDDTIVCEVPMHYTLPSNAVNPSEMIERVINAQLSTTPVMSRITQTPPLELIYEYELEPEPTNGKWFYGRDIVFFQGGSCVAFFVIFLSSYVIYNETPGVILANIQHNILGCLADQYMEAQRNSAYELLAACKNETGDYQYIIQKYLRDKNVQTILTKAQKMLRENLTADVSVLVPENISNVNMTLVIEHLERMKMLPRIISKPVTKRLQKGADIIPKYKALVKEKEDVMNEIHEAVKNLAILNDELHKHILFLSKKSNKSSDAEAEMLLKNLDVPAKGDKELRNELREKINSLLLQNEDLKTKIDELRKAQTEESILADKEKSSHLEVDGGSKFESEEPNVNHKSEKMNIDKEEIGNLAKQIDMLQDSLEDKFPDMKKLHNLIKEFSEQLNGQKVASGKDADEWSWKKLKKNMESFIKEMQMEFEETLSGYKNINVIEVLRDCIQESQKHAENSLKLFTYYLKVVQKKSHEIITKKIPEMSMRSTVEGVWSMWGSLQNKWSSVKDKFDDFADGSCKNIKRDEEKPEVKAEYNDESEGYNGRSIKEDDGMTEKRWHNGKSIDEDDGMTEKKWHNGNWLFKRAESREKERSANVPINWYLCRDMMRRRERKWSSRRHGEL